MTPVPTFVKSSTRRQLVAPPMRVSYIAKPTTALQEVEYGFDEWDECDCRQSNNRILKCHIRWHVYGLAGMTVNTPADSIYVALYPPEHPEIPDSCLPV